MNMEISEEAKQALANVAQRKAQDRLVRDGCRTDAAMRRRLLALAAERNLPPAEYAKLMHKRIMDRSIHEFCSKHGESGAPRTPFPAQGGQQSGDCGQRVMAA